MIETIDVTQHVLDIRRDFSIDVRQRKPGPPERVDGMTMGIVSMSGESPHDGEMHPDGDEILYVISGRIRVTYDSADVPVDLGPGGACVVRKGEWHKVDCLEPAQFIHVTPGPNGDARFKT